MPDPSPTLREKIREFLFQKRVERKKASARFRIVNHNEDFNYSLLVSYLRMTKHHEEADYIIQEIDFYIHGTVQQEMGDLVSLALPKMVMKHYHISIGFIRGY